MSTIHIVHGRIQADLEIEHMKLSDFMPRVYEEANKQIGYSHLSLDNIYKVMDIDISSNKELANPLNKDPKVYYFRPRQTPLSGDEEVTGKYLVFDYCDHNQSMYLKERLSLRETEEYITAPSGMPNVYTTCIIAIIDGIVKHYEISYFDKHKGKRCILDKDEQINSDYPFDATYDEQVQIKWLE